MKTENQKTENQNDFNAADFASDMAKVPDHLKTEEEEEEEGGAGGDDDDENKGGEGGEGGSGGEGGQEQVLEITDPYWKTVKEKYPDVEITQEILDNADMTAEERATTTMTLIEAQIKPSSDDDEFIRSYKEAKGQEGFNHGEWLKAYTQFGDLLEMEDDPLLEAYYAYEGRRKGKNWTKEQIAQQMNKMTDIERSEKADEIRAGIRSQRDSAAQQASDAAVAQMEKDLPGINEGVTENLNAYIEDHKGKTTIGGFRFEDAEREEFFKELPEFTKKTIREFNGVKEPLSEADLIFSEIMADPAKSYQLLPYLYLIKHGKIEGYSTKIVTNTKKKTVNTLDRSTEKQHGSTQLGDFNKDEFKEGM